MNITIITIGSRGDVQPYVALGTTLQKAGHVVTLATNENFNGFVTDHGLAFARIRGDFSKLVESDAGKQIISRNPLNAMRVMRQLVLPMLRTILQDSWEAAQDADLIIYELKAMSGYHAAEKLDIPAIASSTQPIFTPTRAFPHPVAPSGIKLGGAFNRLTHLAFIWMASILYQKLINTWRKEVLGLSRKSFNAQRFGRDGSAIPVLYSYSPSVLPVPADWDDEISVTGYWFLNRNDGWQPSPELIDFLAAGPPPVYVGFGSMAGRDPQRTTQLVIEALGKSGQRGIIASGWGGLSATDVSDTIFQLEEAPHDWLFPKMAAIVHHGGAGTTAASLHAGKPNIICPFFGDQPFWGAHVHALGVGPKPIHQKKLTVENLAAAINAAITDEAMRQRAAEVGKQIRAEDGTGRALEIIENYIAQDKR